MRRRTVALGFLLLSGCVQQTDDQQTRTAYVRKIAGVPGESEMLQMEDERTTFGGRIKRFLGDRDPKVRRRAALAVGRIGDASLAHDLKPLFADRDPEVRALAAFAAGLLRASSLAGDVEALFADPLPEVRSAAVLARSLIGGAAAPPALLALLTPAGDEAAQRVAGEAAVAVARFGDAAAAGSVAPLLANPNPEVRWRAAYALYRLGAGAPELATALGDGDARVRAYAALAAGGAGDTGAVPALIERLADPDPSVVEAAATALGLLKDAQAAEPLAALARGGSGGRRFAAIAALSHSGLAAPTLTELASDPSPHVRALAIDGLRRTRIGRPLVNQALADPDWRVRAAAARALADFGDTGTLVKTLQYDPDAKVVPSVLRGLARVRYADLDNLLLKHLTDKDPGIRAAAAELIASRSLPAAADRLAQSYETYGGSDDLLVARLAILEALARQPPSDKSLNPIKQAAVSHNWLLKTRAWAMLEKLGATTNLEPPTQVNTLRTETFYGELVSRGDYVYHATIETGKGSLVFLLYPKHAPLTVAYLEDVSSTGYFTDLPITELIPAVEIGGGDNRGDGLGQFAGWVRDEPHPTPFVKTMLTLRRPFGRDSGSSQFMVTLAPRPDLDGILTPVGELLSGAEVLPELVPGDVVKSFVVVAQEYRGEVVMEKVRIDRPQAGASPGPGGAEPALGTVSGPGSWSRPPVILYLAIVGGAMLLASLLPVLANAERRSDLPLALWVVLLLILIVAGTYTWMVLSGSYYNLLVSERPGPRVLERANPPILPPDMAMLACTAAMGYIVLELALLYFLMAGKPFARWLFVFLALIEIALFTSQIATGLTLLSIVSQVGIVLNLLKIWFLLTDRQTKEYLS